MIVILKILSIILYIVGGFIVVYGLSLNILNIDDKDTSLKYYLFQNKDFVTLLFLLVGIQIVQFGIMCWDNSAPYIIIGSEEDYMLHWIDTIRNKFVAAAVIGLIYHVATFFKRNGAFVEYKNSEYMRKEYEELKNQDYSNYHNWEQTLENVVKNLDEDSYIYVKCKNGNIYRIGKQYWYGELIHDESSEKTHLCYSLMDIAYDIYINNADIIAITSKNIELL